MKWIPIEEKLPEHNQKVLVCAAGRTIHAQPAISTAEYGWIYDNTFYAHDDYFEERWITHWMPLPEEPAI